MFNQKATKRIRHEIFQKFVLHYTTGADGKRRFERKRGSSARLDRIDRLPDRGCHERPVSVTLLRLIVTKSRDTIVTFLPGNITRTRSFLRSRNYALMNARTRGRMKRSRLGVVYLTETSR